MLMVYLSREFSCGRLSQAGYIQRPGVMTVNRLEYVWKCFLVVLDTSKGSTMQMAVAVAQCNKFSTTDAPKWKVDILSSLGEVESASNRVKVA